MDYEKKYKEALETARKKNNGEPIVIAPGWTIYEVIFPELRESEDERIGNLIYCIIRDREDARATLKANGVSVDMALAYLENQIGQKPVSGSSEKPNNHAEWSEEDIKKIRSEEYTKGFNDAAFGGKSAEWSEEDKDYYEAIIAKLEITQDDASLTDNQMDFLKSLPERFNIQPKQEWSEEDEEMLNLILKYFIETNNFAKSNGASFSYTKEIEWLKSLLLRSHWKPSEEQMDALFAAANEVPFTKEDGNYLFDLYDDLKEL